MVEMKERDMENVTETHKMNQERSYDGETNCKRIILKGSRKEGTDTPVNRIEMKRKWNERTAETDRQSTGLLHTSPLSAFCPSVNQSVNQSFISQSHTKHTTIAVQVSPDRNSSPQQQRLVD